MKTIRYSSSAILTSDDVADAVIEYAAALSAGSRADTVEVPAVDAYGMPTMTKILIGPTSELLIEAADDDVLETPNPVFVARLQHAAASLNIPAPLHAATRPMTKEHRSSDWT